MATKEDLSALAEVLNTSLEDDDFNFEDSVEEISGSTTEVEVEVGVAVETKKVDRDYSLVSVPHWLIKKEDLQKVLDTLSGVVIKTGEILNKSVYVFRNGDKLYLSFNSNNIQGQFKIDVQNKDNLISETTEFILDYNKLNLAVKNSDTHVLLKESTEQTLVVELLGADIELENYLGLEPNQFVSQLSAIDSLQQESVELSKVVDFLKNVSYSEKLSIRPEDKKIRIEGNSGYSNFSSLTIIQYKNVMLKDVSFRILDINFLIKLLDFSKELHFVVGDKNNYVYSDTIKISMPRIETQNLKSVKNICQSLSVSGNFNMDVLSFYKKLNMIRQFTGNGVSVHLFTENNRLYMVAKTSNQRTIRYELTEELSGSINVDAKLPIMILMNTYGFFKNLPTMTVSVTSTNRFIFETETFRIIFGNAMV